MSRYRRRSTFKKTSGRYGGLKSRARSQKFRVSARRKGYGRTSGYYGRFGQGPHAELKFHDIVIDDASIDAGVTVAEDSCNVIAQGTTESTRLGRKITIKSINWRFDITGTVRPNTAAPTGDIVRVILYLDKQTNGAAAVALDILETADYQSFNNLANKSRFRTLMDRTYQLNVLSATGADATAEWKVESIQDSFFKKCNIVIEYDNSGTDGAITSQRSNNIGVLTISKNGVAGFLSQMRLRYSDQG